VTLAGPADLIFVATGGEDEDQDPLTYSFRIASEPGFAPSSLVIGEDGLGADPDGEVVWDLSGAETGLEENGTYYWDVRADDGIVFSPSATARFLFSSVNEAPGMPTAVSPVGGESVASGSPEFVWTNVTDPEGSTVTYTFEVHSDPQLTDLVAKLIEIDGDEGDQTRRTFPELDDNTTYFWRVQGVDDTGETGAWSQVADFRVASGGTAPTQPVAIRPTSGDSFGFGDAITLVWSNSSDAEGDTISYTVEVLNPADQLITTGTVDESDSGGQTSWTVAVTLAAGEYNWRVRAEAGGQRSAPSDSAQFVVSEGTTDGGDGGCACSSQGSYGGATWLWGLVTLVVLRRRRLP
jgi:MYXO-CTERM domain-containing protein